MARNGLVSSPRRRKSEKIDEFVDLLPITATTATATATIVDLNDSDQVVHVLAVDDSLIDRKVIERLLKISSCKVTAVDSGRRALQYLGLDDDLKTIAGFDGLKVDLIITDYCMPGMTGYELLKKIKESSTLREIPVVIMSSENVLARIDRCFEEGAEDFIVKPVKLADVKRLKDYTMTSRDVAVKQMNQDRGINKRKSRETSSDLVSSVSPLSSSPIVISSPTPVLPPTISLSSLSEQSLHTSSLDSPTRRIKMTGCV